MNGWDLPLCTWTRAHQLNKLETLISWSELFSSYAWVDPPEALNNEACHNEICARCFHCFIKLKTWIIPGTHYEEDES